MRAALFPGQGIAPKVVLDGLDRSHPLTREASETLGYDLVRRIEQVARRPRSAIPTSVAQPAIFVAGLTSYERAVAQGQTFDFILGHSLGEYTALAAGEAISFRHGLALVAARGKAMERAAARSSGGMAAVIGLDLAHVEALASVHGVVVANDNSARQVVVSGEQDALAAVAAVVRREGGRCVLLPVEGAFHSAAMRSAAESLATSLFTVEIRNPALPVISNVSARPYRAPGEIRRLLEHQMTGRVRFRECVAFLSGQGVTEHIDLGPGDIVGRIAQATARPTMVTLDA